MTAGCEADKTFPATFQAGQSYTAQDLNQPSVTRTVFSIATSGSATVPPPIIGTGKGSVEDPLVGSGVVQGDADRDAVGQGRAHADQQGQAGHEPARRPLHFTLLDKDPKAGLTILGPSSKAPINLTGVKFVGKKTRALMLGSGTLVVLRRPAELPLHRRHRPAGGLAGLLRAAARAVAFDRESLRALAAVGVPERRERVLVERACRSRSGPSRSSRACRRGRARPSSEGRRSRRSARSCSRARRSASRTPRPAMSGRTPRAGRRSTAGRPAPTR